jgi:hypothetical protein
MGSSGKGSSSWLVRILWLAASPFILAAWIIDDRVDQLPHWMRVAGAVLFIGILAGAVAPGLCQQAPPSTAVPVWR